MIRGSFEIWEFVVLVGAALILIGGFILNTAMGIGSPEVVIFAGFVTMTSTLFVRPVWLLVNKNRINDWERAKATITNKVIEKVTGRYANYVTKVTLSFMDKMDRHYNEVIVARSFLRRMGEGAELKIAFDPKHPDRLIVPELARRQVKVMTITGIILIATMAALWAVAFVLDKK